MVFAHPVPFGEQHQVWHEEAKSAKGQYRCAGCLELQAGQDEHSKDRLCFISVCTALSSSSSMLSSSVRMGKDVFRSILWNKMLQGAQSFLCSVWLAQGEPSMPKLPVGSSSPASQTRAQGDHCVPVWSEELMHWAHWSFPQQFFCPDSADFGFIPPSCNESHAPVTGSGDVGANTCCFVEISDFIFFFLNCSSVKQRSSFCRDYLSKVLSDVLLKGVYKNQVVNNIRHKEIGQDKVQVNLCAWKTDWICSPGHRIL